MPIQIFDCAQRSGEWYAARAGIPTASKFAAVMREGGKGPGGSSVERENYLNQIAGEIITGQSAEEFSYFNQHMDRGKEMEVEARAAYAFHADVEPQIIGFVRNGNKGSSPDAFIGNDGVLEIKTEIPARLIATIKRNIFPATHIPQCQGNLWVTEREWVDIAIYWPKMPLFLKRAYRDESIIRKIASAVNQFNEEVAEVVERVRAYRVDALGWGPMTPREQFLASVDEDLRP